MILKGEKVTLKPIKKEDSKDFVCWRNSKFVKSSFIIQTDFTVEQQNAWIDKINENNDVKQFIIYLNTTNEKIGTVYLKDIDYFHEKAEFGIFLKSTEMSGKGYGSDATNAILKYAFCTLSLNKVYLRVLEKNTIAIKSYEKNHFVKEGVAYEDVKINGIFVNVVFMSILRKNFEQNKMKD